MRISKQLLCILLSILIITSAFPMLASVSAAFTQRPPITVGTDISNRDFIANPGTGTCSNPIDTNRNSTGSTGILGNFTTGTSATCTTSSSTNGLQLTAQAGTTNAILQSSNFYTPPNTSSNPNGIKGRLGMEMKVQFSDNTSVHNLFADMFSNGTTQVFSSTSYPTLVRFDSTGKILDAKNNDIGALIYSNGLGTYSPNTWYDVIVDLNLPQHTYSAWINGTLVVDNFDVTTLTMVTGQTTLNGLFYNKTVQRAPSSGSSTTTIAFAKAGNVTDPSAVPSINTQPAAATVGQNGNVSLSISASASDGGTLSYQWYSNTTNSNSNGSVISGATNASYAAPTSTLGTTYYYVDVTNAKTGFAPTSLISNPAAITVIANAATPSINTQPVGATVNQGDSSPSLSVAASVTDGGTLSYQWYSNATNSNSGGTAISGATNASYAVPTATAGTTYYYVVVTNTKTGFASASAPSNAAAVTVNNLNAATPSISAQPAGATVTQNASSPNLSVSASVADGGTLSYQWYSNSTNSNSGGTAINGATSASFAAPTSTVGTTYYYVVVTNTNRNAVNQMAAVASNAAAVTVNTLTNAAVPSIGTQPVGATVNQGDSSPSLSVVASVSDGGTLSYQWYSNTTSSSSGSSAISGATSASFAAPTATVGTTFYYVVVTNTNNSVSGNTTATATSNAVAVTVNTLVNAATPSISSQPAAAIVTQNASSPTLSAAASVSDSGTLSYQWYSNTTNNNSGGTAISGATSTSYAAPTATVGTTYYYVMVTNTNNNAVNQTAYVVSNTAAVTVKQLNAATPSISAQPAGATVTQNASSPSLSVSASVTDGGTLSYQWYSNSTNSNSSGTAINGATSASYAAPTSTVGTKYYYVVVTNSNSNAVNQTATVSSTAAVTVNAPAITIDATKYVRDGSYRQPNLDDHFGGFGTMQTLNKMRDWGIQSVRYFTGGLFNPDGSLVNWDSYFATNELTNLWNESGFSKWTFVASKVYDGSKYGSGASFDYTTYGSDLKVILTQFKSHSSGLEYVDIGNEPNLASTGAFSGATTDAQKQAIVLKLYDAAESAVKYVNSTVSNGAPLKLGGPATSTYQYSYITSLIDYAKANNKQLDYLTWHVYNNNQRANDMITQYNQAKSYAQSNGFTNLEYQIGEYGMHVNTGDNYTNTDVARIASHVEDLSYGFAYAGLDHANPWINQTVYQWSFNQIDFNYVQSNGNTGWQTYDVTGGNTRYLKLIARYTALNPVDIQEVQFLDQNNNIIPVTFTGTSNFKYLFDGNLNTHYTASWDSSNPYGVGNIKLDLGQMYNISKMKIYWGNITADQKVSLTTSTDNIHWNDAISDARLLPAGMLYEMWKKLDAKLLDSTYTDPLVRAMPTISADGNSMKIMVWNRSDTNTANANLTITNLPASFQGRDVNIKTYLIDSTHSNIAYDPQQTSLYVVQQGNVTSQGSSLNLNLNLDHNAISLIELTPGPIDAATPIISSQPAATTVTQNASSPTLSVAASVSDSGTLSYQWYSNTTGSNSGGTAISDATNASYAAPTATVGTTYYYVVVTNTNNNATDGKTATATSNVVAVMVNGTERIVQPGQSIQSVIDSANAGDTIVLSSGVYTEQLNVDKNLTIKGAGQSLTTIQSPDTAINSFAGFVNHHNAPVRPIVYIAPGVNVKLQGITIDGRDLGNINYPDGITGIGIDNSSATIDQVTITGVNDTVYPGMQYGYGIFANNTGTTEQTVTVTNSNVTDYQKNGIFLMGNLMGTVTGNNVTGHGATSDIAQNGIVFLNVSGGTISGNTVTQNYFTGSDSACGILVISSGQVFVSGNADSLNQTAEYIQ